MYFCDNFSVKLLKVFKTLYFIMSDTHNIASRLEQVSAVLTLLTKQTNEDNTRSVLRLCIEQLNSIYPQNQAFSKTDAPTNDFKELDFEDILYSLTKEEIRSFWKSVRSTSKSQSQAERLRVVL